MYTTTSFALNITNLDKSLENANKSKSTNNIYNEVNVNDFDEGYYASNMIMPLIVLLFVAMLLGWMLVRYKMSAVDRSTGSSVYCCPESCFNCCANFFSCKFRRSSMFFKKSKSNTPKITIR